MVLVRKRDGSFGKGNEVHHESNVWSKAPRKTAKDLNLMRGWSCFEGIKL